MRIKMVKAKNKEGFGWYDKGIISINLKRLHEDTMGFTDFKKCFIETLVHEYVHYLMDIWKIRCGEKREENMCRKMEKI